MGLGQVARKFLARRGIEAHWAHPLTTWRTRLPALLNAQHFDLVLDVGANDGEYASGLLENGYRGEVLSFEAQPDVASALRRRAAGYDNWYAHDPVALSDEEGEATFHIAGNSLSSSLLPMGNAHVSAAPQSAIVGSYTVPTRRLDAIMPGLNCGRGAFLKIDVQGAEHLVLEGAGDMLAGPVRGVQLEMSLMPLYDGQWLAGELDAWLRDRGFELWDIAPGFRDPKSYRLLQYDGVYLRP